MRTFRRVIGWIGFPFRLLLATAAMIAMTVMILVAAVGAALFFPGTTDLHFGHDWWDVAQTFFIWVMGRTKINDAING